MIEKLISLTIILSSGIYILSSEEVEQIKKDACVVTDKYIESVEYKRKQAEMYGIKDVYIFEKQKEHNENCK